MTVLLRDAARLVSTVSLLTWVWLVLFRGQFWRTDQRLAPPSEGAVASRSWPSVSVIIPARNEADVLPQTLPTVLQQAYRGPLHVFLVDDRSEDGTGEVARQIAARLNASERLTVVGGEPLPHGWAGKVWALQQGITASERSRSEYILLTDADIAHPLDSVQVLVEKALSDDIDLVSLMAKLQAETAWERLLIPAFVYFFAKLYPFRWVNDPAKITAAAAGGCVLVRREALERCGGLAKIAAALIDDCALAKLIKMSGRPGGGRLWLGLTHDVRSLRSYHGLAAVWSMVTRSAFTQLNYSPVLLAGTVAGMLLTYVVPPMSAFAGLGSVIKNGRPGTQLTGAAGLAAWVLMASSFLPMLRWYSVSPLYAPLLPVAGLLYTLMTIDSARRYWQGRGGAWKGRSYQRDRATLRSKAKDV